MTDGDLASVVAANFSVRLGLLVCVACESDGRFHLTSENYY